jgi:hypothetical protein
MRFFEFKLPQEGSAFAKELEQLFLKLLAKAKSLPETDPKRQEFNDYLQDLADDAGVKEDLVADASTNLIKTILIKSGVKEASLALMDLSKIMNDTAVQNELKQMMNLGAEQEKEQRQQIKKGFDDLGAAIANKLSQPAEWGIDLVHGIQASSVDPELLNVFLDQCVKGTAMKWPFVDGVQEVNFKSLLSTEAAEILRDKRIQKTLMEARWATGASGKATGDGEVFVGMLADAGHEAKGDIVIKGTPYEVKATKWAVSKQGGMTNTEAWLDAGPYAEDIAGIKNIFSGLISDRKLRVPSEMMAAADFRKAGLGYLKKIMKKVKDPENLLTELHLRIFPDLTKQDVQPGVRSIIASDYDYLVSAKEQGIMAMKQYSASSPGNFGFIFIDKTTLTGTVAVNAFEAHESFRFSSPITMSKVSTKEEGKQTAKRKAVPGIRVGKIETARQELGWTPKRSRSTA